MHQWLQASSSSTAFGEVGVFSNQSTQHCGWALLRQTCFVRTGMQQHAVVNYTWNPPPSISTIFYTPGWDNNNLLQHCLTPFLPYVHTWVALSTVLTWHCMGSSCIVNDLCMHQLLCHSIWSHVWQHCSMVHQFIHLREVNKVEVYKSLAHHWFL